jgi:hypothetical protein
VKEAALLGAPVGAADAGGAAAAAPCATIAASALAQRAFDVLTLDAAAHVNASLRCGRSSCLSGICEAAAAGAAAPVTAGALEPAAGADAVAAAARMQIASVAIQPACITIELASGAACGPIWLEIALQPSTEPGMEGMQPVAASGASAALGGIARRVADLLATLATVAWHSNVEASAQGNIAVVEAAQREMQIE